MKSWTRDARILLPALAVLALLLPIAGCSSDSPTEPARTPPPAPSPPPPPPEEPTVNYNITVTANPATLVTNDDDGAQITVQVRIQGTGQIPDNGTQVLLTTSLGTFVGGAEQTTVTLIGGRGSAVLLPGDQDGQAVVQASIDNSVGQTTVRIVDDREFFVSFVEPPQGPDEGGQTVDVVGQGFIRPVRVSFGGLNARVLSSTQSNIRVITPAVPGTLEPGTTVTVDVTVTRNVNGEDQASDTLPNGYTFVNDDAPPPEPPDAPIITAVDPPNGPNDGGIRVDIIGDNFEAPVRVLFGRGSVDSFNGLEATVETVTDDRLTVIVPSATGLGLDLRNQAVDVLVRNIDTGLADVAPGAFTYGGLPLNVTGITPLEGPADGGTEVTIFGSGFSEPLQVTIAGIEQEVVSVSPTEIVIRTVPVDVNSCPANGIVTSGPVVVRLLDPLNGVGQSADNFRYVVETPRLVSISPGFASQGGGTSLTVSGDGFDAPVQVRLSANGEVFTGNVTAVTETSVTFGSPAVTVAAFDEESCDDDGDGTVGSKFVPTAFDVEVENLDSGCISNTLPNAVVISPTAANSDCRGDAGPPPEPDPVQCNDGFDNDSDGFIDAADPECTGPNDDNEAA